MAGILENLQKQHGLTLEEAMKVKEARDTEGMGAANSLLDVLKAKKPPSPAVEPKIELEPKSKLEPKVAKPELKTALNSKPASIPAVVPIRSVVKQKREPKRIIAPTQEQAKDRKEDRKVIEKAKPDVQAVKQGKMSLTDLVSQHQQETNRLMSEPRQELGYDTKLSETAKRIDQLKSQMADKEKQKAWMAIADQFGQLLGQYTAASYGLKHGVDMTGVRVKPIDLTPLIDSEIKQIEANILKEEGKQDKLGQELGEKEQQLNQVREGLLKAKIRDMERQDKLKVAKISKPKPTKAQLKLEEQVGKEVAEWVTTGAPNYQDNRKAVMNTIDLLKKPDTKLGGLWGAVDPQTRLIGAGVANFLGFTDAADGIAKGAEAELSIASVIQKSLRETLGGQFAQKEGEDVLRRSFAPGLPKETLIKNAERVLLRLDAAAKAKSALAKRVQAGENISPEEINRLVKEAYLNNKQPPLQFPMIVTKEGKQATIANQQELNEARAEGWK